jgi:hypothetical protein
MRAVCLRSGIQYCVNVCAKSNLLMRARYCYRACFGQVSCAHESIAIRALQSRLLCLDASTMILVFGMTVRYTCLCTTCVGRADESVLIGAKVVSIVCIAKYCYNISARLREKVLQQFGQQMLVGSCSLCPTASSCTRQAVRHMISHIQSNHVPFRSLPSTFPHISLDHVLHFNRYRRWWCSFEILCCY